MNDPETLGGPGSRPGRSPSYPETPGQAQVMHCCPAPATSSGQAPGGQLRGSSLGGGGSRTPPPIRDTNSF